jgi:4-amino-4-deoxy-L-arabinose transferase-like glycosyltransferase
MKKSIAHRYTTIFLIFVAIYTVWVGAWSDVVDIDSAQYAAISMEMVQTDTYLQVFERGKDYLDKPPLLFWISALSFKLFGISNFAYKLPTLLFSLLSLWYTYKLGKYLYSDKVGKLATLFLATSIGFIWANNDVKTDALVTSCIVFSVYHLLQFLEHNRLKDVLLGGLGIGLGMLSKGPMGLIFPFAFVGVHALLHQQWKRFFQVKWLLLPLVVALVLAPMLWGLYTQFDMQPEKVVNNKTGVSGLRFFFWEQSFGRISGENAWKNDTDALYLVHSLLLLMFPFSVLVLKAFFNHIQRAIRTSQWQALSLALSSLLVLTALSLSSYKIPHYTLVLFPFVAIILGHEVHKMLQIPGSKWLLRHQYAVFVLVGLIGSLSFLCFDLKLGPLAVFAGLMVLQGIFIYKSNISTALFTSALTIGFVFNVYLMPGAQQYAQGKRFAGLIADRQLTNANIYFLNRDSRAMEFYLQRRISRSSWEDLMEGRLKNQRAWYYMSLDGKYALLDAGLQIEEELSLQQYDLNRLSFAFLNPATRENALEPRFLIKFKEH